MEDEHVKEIVEFLESATEEDINDLINNVNSMC